MSQSKKRAPPTKVDNLFDDVPAKKPAVEANKFGFLNNSVFAAKTEPLRKTKTERSGATAQCKLVGTVLRVGDLPVQTKNGPQVKRVLDILVERVNCNGAQDIVDAGNEVFLFETEAIESPEDAELQPVGQAGQGSSAPKFKAKPRALKSSARATRVGVVSSNFWKDGGKKGQEDETVYGVGQQVEFWGVSCEEGFSKSQDKYVMYINAKCSALAAAPTQTDAARAVIKAVQAPEMQEKAAHALFYAVSGFAGFELNEAQQAQVDAGASLLADVIQKTGDRLGAMSTQIEDSFLSETFTSHAEAARSVSAKDLAEGKRTLIPTDKAPVAPLAVWGVTAFDRSHGLLKGDGGLGKEPPPIFAAPWVSSVEIGDKRGFSLNLRAGFCYSRDKAVDFSEKGATDVIPVSPAECLSVNASLSDFAQKIGSNRRWKIELFLNNVMFVADFAVVGLVKQASYGIGASIGAEYVCGGTVFVDMIPSICKCSALVSEQYIKTHLCEGAGIYSPEEVDEAADEAKYLPLPKDTSYPIYGQLGLKELSTSNFKFSSFKPPAGKKNEYRVVVPNMLDRLGAQDDAGNFKNQAVLTDVAAGEDFVTKVADGNASFLAESCLVYVVAVPA